MNPVRSLEESLTEFLIESLELLLKKKSLGRKNDVLSLYPGGILDGKSEEISEGSPKLNHHRRPRDVDEKIPGGINEGIAEKQDPMRKQ